MLSGNIKFDLMENTKPNTQKPDPRQNELVIHTSISMLQVWNAEQLPLIKELLITGDPFQTLAPLLLPGHRKSSSPTVLEKCYCPTAINEINT